MKRILVCGSRDWELHEMLFATLDRFVAPDDVLIHGGSRGADAMAGAWASRNGVQCVVYPADWRQNGRAAGPIRNLAMLNTRPDLVLAFSRNRSKGTEHVIAEASRRGIQTHVFRSASRG